jgi:hypothetical protein
MRLLQITLSPNFIYYNKEVWEGSFREGEGPLAKNPLPSLKRLSQQSHNNPT